MAAADSRCALAFSLSPGQAGDAPAGRALLHALPPLSARCHLVMDRAYEGNETRQLALDLGLDPVVPPHPLRAQPWAYNTEIYKRRNEIGLNRDSSGNGSCLMGSMEPRVTG